MKRSGSDVAVWRRADGESAMTKVLETDSATVTTGPAVYFHVTPYFVLVFAASRRIRA